MRKLLLFLCVCCLFSFNKPQLTWVAIGDSITYLNDHQNETGNRITRGYMTRVTEKLSHIQFINQGHNGWTAVRIAENIEKLNLTRANIYSIFLGTNDWWQGKPLGTFKDYAANSGNNTVYGSFRTIINKLRSLNSQAKLILITPMQRVDFVYINNPNNNAFGSYLPKGGQTLEQFARAIDSIGHYEHIKVIDLYHNKQLQHERLVKFKRLKDPVTGSYKNYPYPEFIDVPYSPEKDEYPYPAEAINMTYDGLHPSDKGYAVIAKALIKVMKKYD
jgi:lysophospholipase L1-like esterase